MALMDIYGGPKCQIYSPTMEKLATQPWQDEPGEEAVPPVHDDDEEEEMDHDSEPGHVVVEGRRTFDRLHYLLSGQMDYQDFVC